MIGVGADVVAAAVLALWTIASAASAASTFDLASAESSRARAGRGSAAGVAGAVEVPGMGVEEDWREEGSGIGREGRGARREPYGGIWAGGDSIREGVGAAEVVLEPEREVGRGGRTGGVETALLGSVEVLGATAGEPVAMAGRAGVAVGRGIGDTMVVVVEAAVVAVAGRGWLRTNSRASTPVTS